MGGIKNLVLFINALIASIPGQRILQYSVVLVL